MRGRDSGYQNIRGSGYQGAPTVPLPLLVERRDEGERFRVSEYQDIRISGYQDIRISAVSGQGFLQKPMVLSEQLFGNCSVHLQMDDNHRPTKAYPDGNQGRTLPLFIGNLFFVPAVRLSGFFSFSGFFRFSGLFFILNLVFAWNLVQCLLCDFLKKQRRRRSSFPY